MSPQADDWDEVFLRTLAGEADPELERRVRERLMSDKVARARLVALACQEQALADALGETAKRKPSSRILLPRPRAARGRAPSAGWLLAAAAAAVAALVYLASQSDPPPQTRHAAPIQARAPEEIRAQEPSPPPRVAAEEPPKTPPSGIPERADPRPKEPPAPTAKPEVVVPEAPKVLPEPSPLPQPDTHAKTQTETVVATLEAVDGELWVLAEGRRVRGVAKQGILSGQGLEVAASAGGAELSYPDGTRLKLGPSTVARDFLEPKARSGKRIFLVQGLLTADVRKQPADQPMVIGTPQGEATIVGTRFRLSVEAGEKGVTRLEVEEGKVHLKRRLDGKSVDVGAGFAAVAGTTAAEYKAIPSIYTGLVGYWRFEDPAGVALTDSSGLGHHATLVGKARRTMGRFGQGLELDGATAFVQVPHAPDLNPEASDFSFSIWLRNHKQDVWPWNILFKDNGKFQSYFYLAIGPKPRFEFSTGDAKVTIEGQTGVNDNRWHHLVVVRNGPYSAQLFVDGVLDGSASAAPSGNPSIHTTSPLMIGAGNQTFYAGQIDDARFYNRALSAEEVRQLYAGR